MSAEKRSVTTDALQTLGTLFLGDAGRDAIHLAVEPVLAGERLYPGQHIAVVDGVATTDSRAKKVGIVDPFLSGSVPAGEKFWLIIYPRQISSLRHVWEHPDFPEKVQEEKSELAKYQSLKEEAKEWIEEFAEKIYQSYEDLMNAAQKYVDSEEYTYDNSMGYNHASDGDFEKFWDYYQILTGKRPKYSGSFFDCNC